MKPTLRPYTYLDKSACLSAFISNVPVYFTQDEIALFEAFLDKFQHVPDGKLEDGTHYFVLLENERVLGCGGFGHHKDSDVIFMAWGLIHNDFHKKGFGEKLLKFRIDQIKKIHPGAPIGLDTTQYSYPFFEKFGFRTTKITNDYYEPGMHRYDMVLDISS
ncbi:MAG: GNAT family N-acetyltransferase [Bacteroidia bacterium]